jgi:hypothetical protein
MAVAVESFFPGATTEQYDAAIAAMGLSPGGEHPAAMFHWVANTEDGIRVTDVWVSREEWDRFLGETVAPTAESVGLPQPEVSYIDVHNYMTGRQA